MRLILETLRYVVILGIRPKSILDPSLLKSRWHMIYFSVTQSREISFVHDIFLSCPIVLKFCTGHDNNVLCAKFQTDWTTETDVMDERDFARFGFKMSFKWIS